ncbi:MAG: tRNA lysidine(34) synthetase TilS [Clostridia bacterium]|nr:tRNA lysidine(34) synthetase TilS [Clostridia bacterium]
MINFRDPHALAGLDGREPVLLALSGGADSSALLSMLVDHCKKSGAPLYAAHVDHLIREDEHGRDRDFCRRLCESCGVPIFVLEADIPAIAAESGESTELAARRVRYEYFASLMREHSIPLLCTAHNADDNIETLIFNLTRGTGLRGLCGIPRVRRVEEGMIVRPILDMTKDEILDYCRERGLEYVTDSTNGDDSYSRNRIRLHVIPELRRLNPDVAHTVSRFSEAVSLDYRFISSCAEELISERGISVSELRSTDPAVARCAIALAFEQACGSHLEAVHVEALAELCENGRGFSSVSLPCSMRGRIEGDYLRFSKDEREPQTCENYEITLKTGKNILGEHIILYVSEKNEKNIYNFATRATIASDKIVGDLYARNRRAGDKILMRGMHRELRKLMNEKKIDPELRDSWPVICDGEGILYVPRIGLRDGAVGSPSSEYIEISADIQNS